jgi:hypothetical protein
MTDNGASERISSSESEIGNVIDIRLRLQDGRTYSLHRALNFDPAMNA